jgi:3-oxoadipate enol-lactonase
MRDDVIGALERLGLPQVTLAGHSMGGAVAYLVAMERPGLVERLIVEDVPPPYRRDRAIPARPDGPLDFDWSVVPAIVGEVNAGDPAAWEGLAAIEAPTLLIAGGPASHIDQDKLVAAAVRIPRSQLVTIPAGHSITPAVPAISSAPCSLGLANSGQFRSGRRPRTLRPPGPQPQVEKSERHD